MDDDGWYLSFNGTNRHGYNWHYDKSKGTKINRDAGWFDINDKPVKETYLNLFTWFLESQYPNITSPSRVHKEFQVFMKMVTWFTAMGHFHLKENHLINDYEEMNDFLFALKDQRF